MTTWASCSHRARPSTSRRAATPATPSSTAWRYTFDELGHILTATPPANTTGTALTATTYVYDTASGGARLTRTCDHAAGSSCTNGTRYVDSEYDALGRVTESTTFTGSPTGTEALRTEVTYNAGSQQTGVTYFEGGTQKDALTFTYDSLGRQTVVSRGGNAVTMAIYDPLGNTTSRTDHAISSTASTFTFDWRGNELTASSPTYSGSTSFGWRFDGLVASRTWPTGTNAATFAYDRAKRPTTLTEKLSGVDQATFTQTYNRAGAVTAEGRTLSGISGISGTGSQSFSYDLLHRVTGSSISGGPTQTYGYDANSNRTSWNDGTATTTYDYNETDELTAQHRSGVDSNYAYDAYGNMTSSAVTSAGSTTYTYDAQDRLLSITPPSGGALSFTLDAAGRHGTKSVGGTLAETYGYIGASESIVRIDLASGSTSAAIDAAGNRSATSTSGGGFGWLLPDLHGNVAGAFTSSGSAISDAFRYSAYGTTLAKTTSSLPSPWRYQGRLALNSDDGSGANTDLYDFVFRAYDPNLAAFTSLDTLSGGAQNPLTLNRFVYALGNPATLIDPDGHMAMATQPVATLNYLTKHQRQQRYNTGLIRSRGIRNAVAATRNNLAFETDPRIIEAERLTLAGHMPDAAGVALGWLGHQTFEAVAGVGQGAVDAVVGTGKFARDLGGYVNRFTPMGFVSDPGASIHQAYDTAIVADYIFNHPVEAGGAVIEGIFQPLTDAAGQGEIGNGIGRMAGSLLVFGAVGKIRNLAYAGRAGDRITLSAQDLFQSTARLQAGRGVEGLQQYLSPAEQLAYAANPTRGTRFLGQAVHRATYSALDAMFPGRFQYRTRGIDFFDTWTNQWVELTTPGQVPIHVLRPGYSGASYATYELP